MRGSTKRSPPDLASLRSDLNAEVVIAAEGSDGARRPSGPTLVLIAGMGRATSN
jgi:hypothetical protein